MSRSPLFDIFDPYGTVESGFDLGLSDDPLGVIPVKRKPRVEDLLPEEEKESMLRTLANQGASGLSAAGWILDTPGAVARGLLSEGPMKALSALWETSDERVTGRELLRQYGLIGDTDTTGNFFGGLGAEVLLDPSTYLTLGVAPLLGSAAKTAAGKLLFKSGGFANDLGLAARRAGMGRNRFLRQSLDDIAPYLNDGVRSDVLENFQRLAGDQFETLRKAPLTATNRVGLPGFEGVAFDLYGRRGGDRIASAADWIGNAAKTAPVIGPVVRTANALVNSDLKGMRDVRGQLFGRGITEAETIAGREADRALSAAMVDAMRNVGDDLFRTNEFADAFGNFMEGQADQIPQNLLPLFQQGGGASDLVQAARRWQREALTRANDLGIPLENAGLPYGIDYFFRQQTRVDNPIYAQNWDRAYGQQYDRSNRIASVTGGAAQRRAYTRPLPRWVMNKMARDGTLQDSLRAAQDAGGVQNVIDDWLRNNAQSAWYTETGGDLFGYMREPLANLDPNDPANAATIGNVARQVQGAYVSLADTLRGLPTQYAKDSLPFYGNPLNDLQQYIRSRRRNEAVADVIQRELANSPELLDVAADVADGGNRYTIAEALRQFGMDVSGGGLDEFGRRVLSPAERAFVNRLPAARGGALMPPDMIDSLSLPRQYVDEMARKILQARVPYEANPLVRGIDRFTQRFKTLALLFPSRYTRDMYSGAFAGATQDAFSLPDAIRGQRVGSGVYDSIPNVVRNLPEYQALRTPANLNRIRNAAPRFAAMSDDELHNELMVRKFLADAGGQRLTSADAVSEMGRGASNIGLSEAAPGMAGGTFSGLGELFRRRKIPWDIWSLDRTRRDRNWLLEAGDRAAKASDDFNRIGTYMNRIRKGDAPVAAKQIADLTQVNYRPENFTAFEREVLKRVVPFYSYTKGITPLVYQQLLERPGGLMGQSIRGVNRASEPSEDRFTPEYLRQSSAVPLNDIPFLGVGTPGITRFLTNIDWPHEGLINLFTPGLGNSLIGAAGDSLMKTGQNLLGQTNPLLKGPLELFTNRQFYTGRQLSDLYSMLEHDFGRFGGGPLGRIAEQVVANVPGGSRALGLVRQVRDQRISPSERAAKLFFNALTGMKVQDVDQERTARLAARSTLNQLLDQSQGIHTYENLFIKNEDLMNLSPQEQRQYLLYRVLQAEASRRSRERKKQEMQDPLEMLMR